MKLNHHYSSLLFVALILFNGCKRSIVDNFASSEIQSIEITVLRDRFSFRIDDNKAIDCFIEKGLKSASRTYVKYRSHYQIRLRDYQGRENVIFSDNRYLKFDGLTYSYRIGLSDICSVCKIDCTFMKYVQSTQSRNDEVSKKLEEAMKMRKEELE